MKYEVEHHHLTDQLRYLMDKLQALEMRIDDLHISGMETDNQIDTLEQRVNDQNFLREGQLERLIAALERRKPVEVRIHDIGNIMDEFWRIRKEDY